MSNSSQIENKFQFSQIVNWIYAIWFSCGYILIVTSSLPSWLTWANSFYLILGGFTALVWLRLQMGLRNTILFFLICGGVSGFAEWFGVTTGWWFGTYSYSEQFAPFLFGVPLAIPFAWCMILIISHWALRGTRMMDLAFVALFAVAIDLLLDPVAVVQGYWLWEKTTSFSFYEVPWTNFASWWITAFIILQLTRRLLPQMSQSNEHQVHFQLLKNQSKKKFLKWTEWIHHTPLFIFITLEALFVTIALQHALWMAVMIHLLFIGMLFMYRMVRKSS
jgi:putative membrane protein